MEEKLLNIFRKATSRSLEEYTIRGPMAQRYKDPIMNFINPLIIKYGAYTYVPELSPL